MKAGICFRGNYFSLVLLLFVAFNGYGQESMKQGGIKFRFVCDSLQTVILAESTIRIHVLSDDQTQLIQEHAYCSSKYTELPPGVYSLFIESPKFCNEQIHSVNVTAERLTFIELNLNRKNDPDCFNEKTYTPPVIQSCY